MIESDDVRALPHYDADLDGERAPETVRRARATLATAAAVIIATPEYNSSIPGGLKNWVDWVTRPVRQHVLVGKPVAVLGGDAERQGSGDRRQLGWAPCSTGWVPSSQVVPLAVPEIATEIEPDGSVSDAVDRQLVDLVDALVVAIDARAGRLTSLSGEGGLEGGEGALDVVGGRLPARDEPDRRRGPFGRTAGRPPRAGRPRRRRRARTAC